MRTSFILFIIAMLLPGQPQTAPKDGGARVATITGAVHSGGSPVNDILVNIFPHGAWRMDAARGKTKDQGNFSVEVPLDPAWQLLDVLLIDPNYVYPIQMIEENLERSNTTPREYRIQPNLSLSENQMASILDGFKELVERNVLLPEVHFNLTTIRTAQPKMFAMNKDLSTRAGNVDSWILRWQGATTGTPSPVPTPGPVLGVQVRNTSWWLLALAAGLGGALTYALAATVFRKIRRKRS